MSGRAAPAVDAPPVFTRIRASCAEVARRARSVRIDEQRLAALARELVAEPRSRAALDPAHHPLGDERETLAFVVTLDAVNFGSGWFPFLRKRPGLSGYFTVATSLRERFSREGPWSARELEALDTETCARVFGQHPAGPEVSELMALFARALRELGAFVRSRYGGRFEGLVEDAAGRASGLVECLAQMPLYRDICRYDELEVPFFKRAQLTAADLAAAFGGRGPGAFGDLADLTIFADNLVPHVLRREGVLAYAPDLARRVDREELLAAGSPEEVEIRACAVDAVERAVAIARDSGVRATAQELDFVLWNRGQRPETKAHPRHRTRTPYY